MVGYLAKDAHIKTARIEFIHLLLAPTNASCSKKGSHRVADSLLHRREAFVSSVWSAPGITFLALQFSIDFFQIIGRQHAIAVEEDEELALAVFSTEVASLSGPAILLCVITQRELACIAMHNVFARQARTVLHDDDLVVLESLSAQALQ